MKLRVALFEPRIYELRRIQSFLQTMNLDLDLYRASNVDMGMKILNEQEHFHLIIINSRMSPYRRINEHFMQTVLSRFAQQKYIILYDQQEHRAGCELFQLMVEQLDYDPWIQLPIKPLHFYELLEKNIPNLSSFYRPNVPSPYISIKKRELQQVHTSPADIYIKLGFQKFVKVLNAGDELDTVFYEKYQNKGLKTFYLLKEDFLKYFTSFFPPTLLSKKAFATEEEYVVEAGAALNEIVSEFGISEEVVEIATTLADEVFEILERSNLDNILSALKNSKESFIYDHSFLTSLVCLETAKKFRWYSSKYNRIICMASLLHDADITDSKFYGMELNGKLVETLSREDKRRYQEHPEQIAAQLNRIKEIPSDALGMILRHHEGFGRPKSFPNGFYSTQLSALESLFVMSHEVVLLFYQQLFHPGNIEKKLPDLWEELNKGNFRKYFEELKETVEVMLENMKGEA